jgi:Heavy-metal resistance
MTPAAVSALRITLCVFLGAAAAISVTACAHSPSLSAYAGQQTRAIKALSPNEQADLLAGKGMGLAKAAELNGYPGPMHVLELAEPLALSDEQRRQTQAAFNTMKAEAQAKGQQLVDAEQALDTLFINEQITPDLLQTSLRRIADLQADVRAAHLRAHLTVAPLLSDQQRALYDSLRGYGVGNQATDHQHHKH